MRNSLQRKVVYIALIIVLIAFVFLFSLRAYRQYHVWRSYHNYFNQPNPKIESWMTIKLISQKFNITEEEISESLDNQTRINCHISLNRFCKQYHQNCTEIVDRLNQIIGK